MQFKPMLSNSTIHPSLIVYFSLVIYFTLCTSTTSNQFSTPPHLIISPFLCGSSDECAPSHFCDSTAGFFSEARCVPRLPLNASCLPTMLGACQAGLTCMTRADGQRPGCASILKFGETCNPVDLFPCANPLICDSRTRRCVPPSTTAGSPCQFTKHCDLASGFYCTQGQCQRQKAPGSVCGRQSVNFECADGFCATGGSFHMGNDMGGVCVAKQPKYGVCTTTQQCQQPNSIRPALFMWGTPRGSVICNRPRIARMGHCIPGKEIIKILGAPCNPSLDKCAAGRSLSCRWSSFKKRHVCMQLVGREDIYRGVSAYCTPQSPYSICKPVNGWPVTCRREDGFKLADRDGMQFAGYFGCLRKPEYLAISKPCNVRAGHYCKTPLQCRAVQGVRILPSFRFSPPPPAFCVRVRNEGENCASRFYSLCDEDKGLACVSGICQKVNGTKGTENTKEVRAYKGVQCQGRGSLPCAPGFVCEAPELSPYAPGVCFKPKKIMKEGQLCYDTARFRRRCAKGLNCVRNEKGYGLLTCRKPFDIGAVCTRNEECKDEWTGRLTCPQVVDRSPFEQKCVDSSIRMPSDAPCGPGPIEQCGQVGRLKLACLPKPGRPGPVCQYMSRLFQRCNQTRHVACEQGTACSSEGVCMPNKI